MSKKRLYGSFDYIESLRVVSFDVLAVSGTAVDGDDIVSAAAGAVVVVSEPVVLALFAQLTKKVLADTKAAHTAAVFNNWLVFFMCKCFNKKNKVLIHAKSVPEFAISFSAVDYITAAPKINVAADSWV